MTDQEKVWELVALEHPEFTRAHDASNNHHAVREIIVNGSLTWKKAHEFFSPRQGSRVMDIGANAGIYTAFCGANGSRVTAYEPHPISFSILERMIVETNLRSLVTPINAAVWTYTGTCSYVGHELSQEGIQYFNGGLKTEGVNWLPPDQEKALTTKCISLNDAIGDEDWDCVKIDVEGGEYELLLNARPEKLQQIKFMYIEFHDWVSEPLYERTIAWLQENFTFDGYRAKPSDRWEAGYCTSR